MNKQGPIIIIEDDLDDQLLFGSVFRHLGVANKVVYFSDGSEAIDYLKKPELRPFIILSDINMPRMTGFEIREIVHNDPQLKLKCIPFVFWTTASSPKVVCDAYALSVQGVFAKPTNYDDLVVILKSVVEYWKNGLAPNDY